MVLLLYFLHLYFVWDVINNSLLLLSSFKETCGSLPPSNLEELVLTYLGCLFRSLTCCGGDGTALLSQEAAIDISDLLAIMQKGAPK